MRKVTFALCGSRSFKRTKWFEVCGSSSEDSSSSSMWQVPFSHGVTLTTSVLARVKSVNVFLCSPYCFTIWASSRENLSWGFMSRVDSNRPVQPQKLGRCAKFWIQKLEVLYFPDSEQQRCWSDCADAQADLRLFCWHRAKTGFLMTRLIYPQ